MHPECLYAELFSSRFTKTDWTVDNTETENIVPLSAAIPVDPSEINVPATIPVSRARVVIWKYPFVVLEIKRKSSIEKSFGSKPGIAGIRLLKSKCLVC